MRILVVEGHALLAEALVVALRAHGYDVHRLTLEEQPLLPAGQLLGPALEHHADVVVLEPDLGHGRDGGVLVRPLTRAGEHVVVLTAEEDQARWGGWLLEGARVVLGTDETLSRLLEVLRRLEHRLPVIRPERYDALVRLWDRSHDADAEARRRLALLTPREQEVLGELMAGCGISEIAALDVVSTATVRAQLRAIYAKLGVSSQLAAAGLAHRVGWHPPVRVVVPAPVGYSVGRATSAP